MNKEIKYYEYRKAYINNPEIHPFIFNELWEFFKMKEHWVSKKYSRNTSNLRLKADFCLAFDDVINNLPEDCDLSTVRSSLDVYFNRRVLQDREYDLGLHGLLKQHLKRRRRGFKNDVPTGDLKDKKIIFNLDAVEIYNSLAYNDKLNNKTHPMTKSELICLKKELKKKVEKKFGFDYWEDWFSCRINNYSQEQISSYRKISQQELSRRIKKVDEFVFLFCK